MKEITTVARTSITGTTSYSDLTVTNADTSTDAIPNFLTPTDKNAGESLILMNRNFVKSLEDVADPSCS